MRDPHAISIGDLVRPSHHAAETRAVWSNGETPPHFIVWNAAYVDSDHRSAPQNKGQVHIPWGTVGLVIALRNPSSPGASLIATVQFPEAMVLCAAARLERVDVEC